MQRVTVTLDDDLMEQLDRVIATKGYQNRSEAIRDLARVGIREAILDSAGSKYCVAALVYVYDHTSRELSKRLVQTFHGHHDLSVATMHIHLDHDDCLEIVVMKGKVDEVKHVAEHVIAERGVRHGRLIIFPIEIEEHSHEHGHAPARRHSHIKVR